MIRETLQDIASSLRGIGESITYTLSIHSMIFNASSSVVSCPTDPPTSESTTDPPTSESTTETPTVDGCPETSQSDPVTSCHDIPQECPSGEYWILDGTSTAIQVYCDTNLRNCSCNAAGGWMRVAYLDMTDPTQTCPDAFTLVTRTEPPLRTCGRLLPASAACSSAIYQTYGVEYTSVCGQIVGYQFSFTSAFASYGSTTTIDDRYVDGLSLTHGQSPRQHIWTFAAAQLDETRNDNFVCPCTRSDLNFTGSVPPFIGQDYFCATGSREEAIFDNFYADDPLWDGQGCGGTSTCCEFNSPPWFCKQLPQSTTDDIELRFCSDSSGFFEDTPIEFIEIYVQ